MSLTTTEWSRMILCKFLAINANLHIQKNLQNIPMFNPTLVAAVVEVTTAVAALVSAAAEGS